MKNKIVILANLQGDNNISLQQYDNNIPVPRAIKFKGNNSQFNGRFLLHPSIDTIIFTKKDAIIKNLNIPVESNSITRNITIKLPKYSVYEYIKVPNNLFITFNKKQVTITSKMIETWSKISEQVYYDLVNNDYSITSDKYHPISRAFQIAFQQSNMTIEDFIKAFYDATGTEIASPQEIKSTIDEMLSKYKKEFLSIVKEYLPEGKKIDDIHDIKNAVLEIQKLNNTETPLTDQDKITASINEISNTIKSIEELLETNPNKAFVQRLKKLLMDLKKINTNQTNIENDVKMIMKIIVL